MTSEQSLSFSSSDSYLTSGCAYLAGNRLGDRVLFLATSRVLAILSYSFDDFLHLQHVNPPTFSLSLSLSNVHVL